MCCICVVAPRKIVQNDNQSTPPPWSWDPDIANVIHVLASSAAVLMILFFIANCYVLQFSNEMYKSTHLTFKGYSSAHKCKCNFFLQCMYAYMWSCTITKVCLDKCVYILHNACTRLKSSFIFIPPWYSTTTSINKVAQVFFFLNFLRKGCCPREWVCASFFSCWRLPFFLSCGLVALNDKSDNTRII